MTIKVTREQQEAVRKLIEDEDVFEEVYEVTKDGEWVLREFECLNNMTGQQFAAAWLGVAEIEPEPVEPWEAYKAIHQGKKVKATDKYRREEYLTKKSHLGNWFDVNLIGADDHKFYIIEG